MAIFFSGQDSKQGIIEPKSETGVKPEVTETKPNDAEQALNVTEPKQEIVEPKQEVVELKQEVLESKQEVAEPKQEIVEPKQEVVEPKREAVKPDSSTVNVPESKNKFLKFCTLPDKPGKTDVSMATVTPQRPGDVSEVFRVFLVV